MEATEILEADTEEYSPVSNVEYVDESSVVKSEDEDHTLNYLEDTTEYEEWFGATEEVDAVTVTASTEDNSSNIKNSSHWFIISSLVLVSILVAVFLIFRKRK